MLYAKAMGMISRRNFLGLAALAVPATITADALWDTHALRVHHLEFPLGLGLRLAHFSDLHFKGDAAYAGKLVDTINELGPDLVCFTGDLIEQKKFAPAALDFIRQIKSPVFGNPGNHDYSSGASFADFARAFASTGGAWLVDRSLVFEEPSLELVGIGRLSHVTDFTSRAPTRIVLAHFPVVADGLRGFRFNLILAGHSHGGQVRVPFLGPIALPHGTGNYDLGWFETSGGPLYVNPGIGTYRIPIRWNCRPEVTLFRL
ncbi:MAG: metallophosphoesterase [Verrucomicrobiota bacterium]|nr:metallophosphoesterase [Verrucomicrobiota bacterium]